jgi:ectoine hydroxylase-related dioxygenase (phytanoyl-CoA dioxygenase family)
VATIHRARRKVVFYAQEEAGRLGDNYVSTEHLLLSVRVHLDDCGTGNGPLDVLPGSHRHGRLFQAEVERRRDREKPVPCLVRRGGLILMRPLLLHRSLSAILPQHRRVIHIEYANVELPHGLNWYQARG